jgi:hypothetical protein
LASVCACTPRGGNSTGSEPRPLSAEELAELSIDGSFSTHLPIRFSAVVKNPLQLEVRRLDFVVDGRRFEISRRIGPGEERRLSFQWVYPEDEDSWHSAGSVEVPWSLVGAQGSSLGSR